MKLLNGLLLVACACAFLGDAGAVGENNNIKVIISDDADNVYVSVFNASHEPISANNRFAEGYIYSGSDIEFEFSPVGGSRPPSRFDGGEPRFVDPNELITIAPGKSAGNLYLKCYISYLFSLSDGEYDVKVKYSPFEWHPLSIRNYYTSSVLRLKMKKCNDRESGIIRLDN